jgi:tRNA G10  N-methylase Trm11
MKYFFILGKNPTLSSAEIAAVLENLKIEFSLLGCSSEVLLAEINDSVDASKLMSRLGGTVKIGQAMRMETRVEADEFADIILEKLPAGEKVYFGFSFYKLDEAVNDQKIKKLSQEVKKLGMEIKKELKQRGFVSRWVTSKDKELSSVVVQKNKLLTHGTDIVVLVGEKTRWIGKTLAVQEFEEYSFRDYGRPARDMRVGLMPPKLAKVMINLAKVNFDQVILDPFCGFGTILGEAALLGCKNLIGSDLNKKTLEGAKQNLAWLVKNYQLSNSNFQLLSSDVRDLEKKLSPQSVEAIITEPYLGPPLKGNESKEKLQNLAKEIEKLYLDAFSVFKKILKKDGKIVIIFPVYRFGREKIYLNILSELEKMEFEALPTLPQCFAKYSAVKMDKDGSVLYYRPDQKVYRQILTFLKK